ncbi:MAG: hypothetical protein PHD09_06545, partial [Candidatus Omnitrophica bacterium]|nr:hypothetical protein [Candidatus Omnitrophota bacterium]
MQQAASVGRGESDPTTLSAEKGWGEPVVQFRNFTRAFSATLAAAYAYAFGEKEDYEYWDQVSQGFSQAYQGTLAELSQDAEGTAWAIPAHVMNALPGFASFFPNVVRDQAKYSREYNDQNPDGDLLDSSSAWSKGILRGSAKGAFAMFNFISSSTADPLLHHVEGGGNQGIFYQGRTSNFIKGLINDYVWGGFGSFVDPEGNANLVPQHKEYQDLSYLVANVWLLQGVKEGTGLQKGKGLLEGKKKAPKGFLGKTAAAAKGTLNGYRMITSIPLLPTHLMIQTFVPNPFQRGGLITELARSPIDGNPRLNLGRVAIGYLNSIPVVGERLSENFRKNHESLFPAVARQEGVVISESDLLVDQFGNALTERGQRLQQAVRASAARTTKILGPDGKPVDGSADSRPQSGIVDANGDSVSEVAFSGLAKPRSSGLILPRETAPAEQPAAIISARGAESEVTPQEVMTRAEQLRRSGQRPTVIARTNEGEWIVADPTKSNYGERMGKIGQAQEGGRLASIRESYVDSQAAKHFKGQPEAGFTEAPREGQPRRVVIVHDPNSRNALTHAAAEDFVSLAEANARGRSHPDNADTARAHETAQDLAPVEISRPDVRLKQPAGTLPIIEESPAPISYPFLRPANQPFQEAQVAEIAARSRSSAPKIRPEKIRDEVQRASDVLGTDPVAATRRQLAQIRRSPSLTPEEKIVAEMIVASRNQVIAESGGYKSSFLEWQADSTARIEQGRQQNPNSAVEAIAMPGSTKTVVNAIQAMLRGAEGRSVHMLEPNAENVRAKSQSESPLTALWTEKLGRPVIRIYATGNGQAVERFNPATGRFEALKGSPKQARAAAEALLRQNPLIYIDEASLLSLDLEGSPIVGQGKNGTTLIHDDPNYTRMHEGMRRGGRPQLYETRDYLAGLLANRDLVPEQRAQTEAYLDSVQMAITEAESQVRLFDRIGRIARDRYMRDPLHAVRFEGGEIRLAEGRNIVTQVAREYGLELSEAQTSQLVVFCDRVGWVLETQRHSRTDYVSTGPDGAKVRLAHDGVRWEGIDGERMTGIARKILRLISVPESAGMRDKVEAWLTADAPETNVVRIYYKYGLSDVMMSTGTPMTAATADGYVHQVNLTARASLPEGMYHRIVARGNTQAIAEGITQDFIATGDAAPVKLVLVTGNTGEPIEATLKAVASRNRVSVIRVSEASIGSGKFDTAHFLKTFEGSDTVVIYASGENPMVRSRIIDIVTAARKARI